MIERNQIFINGKWADSSGRDVITVINPATEEPFATVPRGTAEDADRAVQAAADVFAGWSQSSVQERFKLSGVGREWGRFGIEEFLEYKSVIG